MKWKSLYVLIAFSRCERERILILFRRRQKSRFLDCKLAAPLSFCRGFEPRFRVHWAQNEARPFLPSVLAAFVLFDVLRFSWNSLVFTSIAFGKKKMQSQCRLDWAFFNLRRKRTKSSQSTCIRDDMRSRLLVCRVLPFVVVWFWTVCGVFGQDARWSAFVA